LLQHTLLRSGELPSAVPPVPPPLPRRDILQQLQHMRSDRLRLCWCGSRFSGNDFAIVWSGSGSRSPGTCRSGTAESQQVKVIPDE
jgi:hypothetical protein